MRALLLSVLVATWLIGPAADARETTLERWVDAQLIPDTIDELATHPRFRQETVMFVVLDDDTPASVSNRLALSLRDRLVNAAIDRGGIDIAWQHGARAATATACQNNEVDYYVGLDIHRGLTGRFKVTVRALDIVEREWVAGFGRHWSGGLNAVERKALRETATDTAFRGSRDVPFRADQADLLADHLAGELACALHRQTGGEYVIAIPGSEADEAQDSMPENQAELVGNHLLRSRAVEQAAGDLPSNAILSAKAHRIDGALHQYWVSVTPTTDDTRTSVTASAYVLLPGGTMATAALPARQTPRAVPATIAIPANDGAPVIGPLFIREAAYVDACPAGRSRFNGVSAGGSKIARCSIIQADAHGDAVVFLLHHQTGHGLVRIGSRDCRQRATARVVTTGDVYRFPIALVHTDRPLRPSEWLIEPERDTYYAVAISDSRVARRVANHIDRLPSRCGVTLRQGIEHEALERWLEEFADIAGAAGGHIDWRAIAVEDLT